MKRKLLMTAAAIALMAGMNGASAQTGSGEQQQPRMQTSAPGAGAPKGEENDLDDERRPDNQRNQIDGCLAKQ